MTMQATASTEREDRLHDAVAACLEAAEVGRLDRSALLARYPEFAAELSDFLAGHELIDRLTGAVGIQESALPADGEFGALLGDFRIDREIGRGGMGVVYEAEQVSLRRRVALKLLPFAAAMDARQLQRFRNEAQAAAQLHHSNIVPVFAVGCERGVHYYAMQLIDGMSLADLIRGLRQSSTNALPTASADTLPKAALSTEPEGPNHFHRIVARLGIQAAEAIDYAHGFGVVHRDIKPANLLLDSRGCLWVTDFGLARLQNEAGLTHSGDLLGTLRYMSPEQALGRPERVDPRSDVYSLGATLYELLTLQPAVSGVDRQELLRHIGADEPRSPRRFDKTIPPDLETIILKAIAKDATDRYSSAKALADDLRHFLSDEPIHARRPTLPAIAARWARRHRAVVGAVTAVLIVAVVALGASSLLLWREAESTRSEKERAEENLRLALDSLDRMYLRVAEERAPREPRWEQQDRELLQAAMEFYEQLARQNRGGTIAARTAAKAFGRVGAIRKRLGQPAAAEEAYRQAIALAESITRQGDTANPEPADREMLAGLLMNFGILLENTRQLNEAEQALQRAQSLYRDLVAQQPDGLMHRRNLASSYENLGLIRHTAGRSKEAETAYRRALTLREEFIAEHPLDAEAREALASALQGLGHLLRTDGRAAEAVTIFGRSIPLLVKLTAESPERVRPRQLLANGRNVLAAIFLDLSRPREAEQELREGIREAEKLATEYPGVPEYRRRLAGHQNLLGIVLTDAGRLPEAEPHYRRALELLEPIASDPAAVDKERADYADTHQNLAILLQRTNHPADAERYLRAALVIRQALSAKAPDVSAHWQHLAQNYEQLGSLFYGARRFEEADQAWTEGLAIKTRLVREWESIPVYRNDLANCYYDRARFDWRADKPAEAEASCRQAMALHARLAEEFPNTPDFRRYLARDRDMLAMILNSMGQLAAAEESFRAALAAWQKLVTEFPEVSAFRYGLALTQIHFDVLLLKTMRLQESETLLREVLVQLGKLADQFPAMPMYRRDLADTHTRLASILSRTGRAAEAEASYRQVVILYERLVAEVTKMSEYQERLGRAHYRLAAVIAVAGRHAEAVAAYRQAIRFNPGDARAFNNLAWLLATSPDLPAAEPAEAVALAQKAVDLDPKAKDNWGTLGAARFRAGDWVEAKTALEQAVRMTDGGTAFEMFFLAMSCFKLGDVDQARTWYDKAVTWMDKRRPRDAELLRIRAEAKALLGSKIVMSQMSHGVTLR